MRPLGSHVTRHTHIPLLVASAKECLHPFTGTLAGKLHAPNGPLRDFTSPAGYHTSNGWGAVHGKGSCGHRCSLQMENLRWLQALANSPG